MAALADYLAGRQLLLVLDLPPAELTFMAQRAGAHITDVKAGHLSLITKAPVVTRVILQAVQATG